MAEVIPLYIEPIRNRVSSLYYTTRNLLVESLKRPEDVKFLVFHPKDFVPGAEHWNLPSEGVEYLPYDEDFVTKQPQGYVNNSFRVLQKRKDYYVILNARLTASHLLQKVCGKMYVGFHPTIVNHIRNNLYDPLSTLNPTTRLEVVSCLVHHFNLFTNDMSFKWMTKHLSEFFLPSLVKDFMNRSVVINLGVDQELIDQVPVADVDPKKFVMLYGGRMSPQKRIDINIEVAKTLFEMGVPVVLKLYLTLAEFGEGGKEGGKSKMALMSRNKMLSEYTKYPFVEIEINKVQKDFFSMGKRADVFLGTSMWESYGGAYAELMCCGGVGIFFDRPWVDAFVQKDYKYRGVKTVQEAVGIAHALWKRKGDKETVEKAKAWMREHHNRKKYCNRTIDLLTRLSQALAARKKVKRFSDILEGRI